MVVISQKGPMFLWIPGKILATTPQDLLKESGKESMRTGSGNLTTTGALL